MTPDFLERLDVPRALRLLDAAPGPHDPAHVGRFRIVRRLGAGASGIVYLATDPDLGRPVALKVLAPALARDAATVERFAAEARVAGGLEHPRIVPVHEIGRDGDAVYIAMAYREGVTLRERMRAGPLPVAEAVRIAAEIAEGLAAAHAAGVVHRDVKPENVLLTARGACLLDFGIAKMVGQTLTVTGATLGTPAYMSPEQTRGEAVDARTDVWSLGVVLHEMLGGSRPFRGESGDAVVYGVRHDAPPPLPGTVPASVRRLVARCLSKAPAARPASAGEVMAALAAPDELGRGRRALATALVALACAGAAWLAWPARADAPALPLAAADSMVALLPFAVDSASPPPDYLSTGLFGETGAELSAVLRWRMVNSGSVRVASGQGDGVPGIARRFGARALVTSTFRQRGDSLELALAVLGPDGGTRWSGRLVRPLTATADVPHEARDLVLAALGEAVPAAPRRRVDPLAHDLLLRSMAAVRESNEYARQQAAPLAAEAIERDSTFAPAYVQLARVLEERGTAADGRRVRALAERALALDSASPSAYNVLGQLVAFEDRDWARAEAMLGRAVELEPGSWGNHAALLTVRLATGRAEEALAGVLAMRETDPLTARSWNATAAALLMARHPDAAIGAMRQSMAVDSSWTLKANLLGRALLAAGRTEEAIGWLRQAGSHFVGFEGRAVLAHALGRAGRTAEAREIAALYERRMRDGEAHAPDLAVIHLGLGDTARALDWLERAPDGRGVKFYHVDPIWDPLRASPRFAAVVRRFGIEPAVR